MDAVREGRLGSLFYSGLVRFGRDWSGLLGIRHGLTFAVALVRRDKSSRQSGGQGEPTTCCGAGGIQDARFHLLPPGRPKAHSYGYTVTTRMYIGLSGVFTVTSKGHVRLRLHLGLAPEPSGPPISFFPGRGFFKRHKRHKRHNLHEHWAFLPSEASQRSVTSNTSVTFLGEPNFNHRSR